MSLLFYFKLLPQGLIGLLLAVILSAAMSSLPLRSMPSLQQRWLTYINVSMAQETKGITYGQEKDYPALGALPLHFALVGNLFENLIQLINIIGSLFGTIWVFSDRHIFKTIKANGVFYVLFDEIIVLIVHSQEWVSFLWLNVIGAVLTVLTAVMIQLISKE